MDLLPVFIVLAAVAIASPTKGPQPYDDPCDNCDRAIA